MLSSNERRHDADGHRGLAWPRGSSDELLHLHFRCVRRLRGHAGGVRDQLTDVGDVDRFLLGENIRNDRLDAFPGELERPEE